MVALDSAIPPVVLLLSKQLVNRVVAGAGLTTVLLAVVIGLGLASGLDRAMSAVRNHWQDIFSQRVQQAATVRFLGQAGTIDLGHLDQPEFQDHMERANNGWRSGDLTQTGIGLAGNLFSLAGMLGILLSIQPLLVVLGLLSVVPSFALQRRANRRIFDFWYSWTPLERERDYLRWLLSRPHWAKEMRAFQLSGYLVTRYSDLARQNLVILAGLYRSANRGAGIGAIASIAGEVSLIFGSILVLDQNARYLNSYFEFVATPPLIRVPVTPRALPDLRRSPIEFRDVSFRYPKSVDPVLESVSLTVEPGELVALVGANGSGKTTLVQLLLRLYDPASGQIHVGGVDLRDVDPAELRSHIGVLFQEYGRYELRLRDSVHFGRIEKQPTDDELLACLRASQANEVLRDLPSGLDSNIGKLFEGGHDLSTGQWQRVALARLVFRSADVWVLDEPTASLDPEAEAVIFAELRRHLQGRTGIVISHRFSTVRTADKIAVIERGRLRELGSHDDLVAAGGRYAELFELQAAGYR